VTALLEACDVHYRRGGRQLLDGLSLTVEPGESLAVVGPSGSGKSSLLAVLAGLEPADSGRVRLSSQLLRPGDVTQRRKLGLVLQGYGLLSLLTAAENVEVALQSRGVTGAEVRGRAAQALAAVGLHDVSGKLLDKLSGGQQQRVAVARAMVSGPELVLADEPTAELDRDTQDMVMAYLLDATSRGASVVIATHDPAIADRCDRRLRLHAGRLTPD
jgi:heme ABC exporter ATP-binding subunit CcmA